MRPAAAVHRRQRPGRRGEGRRPRRHAVPRGRPRVGRQPGRARPAGNVCRARGGRRALAVPDARSRDRRASRRDGAGRHHGAPGAGRRSEARRRRNDPRQRRQRGGRVDRHPNGQGAGRPGDRHHQRRREGGVLPVARRRPRARPRDRRRARARARRSCPRASTSGGRRRATPNFDTAVACLGRRGRLVLMAGRTARPELPVGPFYSKCCRHVRLRDVPRGAGVAAARGGADQPLAGLGRARRPRSTAWRRSTKRPSCTGCRSRTRSTRAGRRSAGSWW